MFYYQRGEEIFTSQHIGKKGKLISYTFCHTINLENPRENINTIKKLKPLSMITNPSRFTKVKTVKKWLRRNFKDVYNRVGTAQEKGDVVLYMTNFKSN